MNYLILVLCIVIVYLQLQLLKAKKPNATLSKKEYASIYALKCILNHLYGAKKDPRKREQLRAGIALKHINEWFHQGLKQYEEAVK